MKAVFISHPSEAGLRGRELAKSEVWISLICLLLSSVSLGSAFAEKHYNSSNQITLSDAIIEDWLVIETPAGISFEDEIVVSGFTEVETTLLKWDLRDSRLDEGDNSRIESLVEESAGDHIAFSKVAENRWNWSITIGINNSVSCMCILELLGLAEDGGVARTGTTFITGDVNGSQAPFGILFSPTIHTIISTEIKFEGIITDDSTNRNDGMFEAMLCRESDCPLWQSWNTSSQLIENTKFPLVLDEWNDQDRFSATLDLGFPQLSSLVDGVWLGCIIATDAAMNVGQPIWFRVSVNRLYPVANLSGPNQVNETEVALIDGTASLDPGWAWEGLQFIWMIHDSDDNMRVPHQWEWEVGAVLSLDTNNSGDFTILLTVVDCGGKMNSTSHNVKIINQIPRPKIVLEGVELKDDEVLRLPKSESWFFDSSQSTDDEVARGGVDRKWYLDGELVGNTAILELKFEQIDGLHELILILTDDDGATDNLSIQIVVAGASMDPSSATIEGETDSWRAIAFIVISSGALIWLLKIQIQSKGNSTDSNQMPSWKKEKGRKLQSKESFYEDKDGDD
ncbi:hypothetical protein OAJ94_00380 [Deltaproteobacteria bacterium]|nr:hypothetical protein [Deltaproteobacteria bacterium]